MLYLVSFEGRKGIVSMPTEIPDDFDFRGEVNMDSRKATFDKLLEICKEQVPNGFHPCGPLLQGCKMPIVAISKLG